jgi:hypothetical protein
MILHNISDITLLGSIFLTIYVERLIRRITKQSHIKKFNIFIRICILILSVAVLGWISLTLMDFYKRISLQILPFSEYLRVRLIYDIFLILLSIGLLSGEIVLLIFANKNNIYRIARDNCICNYTELIRRDEIEAAEEALIAASDVDTEGVISWAVRAMFCNAFLPSRGDADEYMNTATKNLERIGKITNEDKATYEFCVSNLLLSKNDYVGAIEHIKKSLDLHFDCDREVFLKKVQDLERNEKSI